MKALLLLISLFIAPCSFAKTYLVGTSSDNPPFGTIASQHDIFFGFDIDMMTEICKRIKIDCKFKSHLFNDLFGNLKAGKIDLAIAAIIITPDRQENFLFSLPYLQSDARFITLHQSPIKQPSDIGGKTVGTRLGTPFKDLAIELYKNKITLIDYSTIPIMLDALSHNKVDIILMGDEPAKFWNVNNTGVYKLIGSKIPIGKGYGIMANKGQDALMKRINQALLNMEEDGTYLQIYTRYFE